MSRLDTIIGIFITCAVIFITILLIRGDQTVPAVSAFEFVPTVSGANTSQIRLTFNRSMDKESVEAGFQITPSVSGKFSWIGRKVAFTPDKQLAYGSQYDIIIHGARDTNGLEMPHNFSRTLSTSPRQIVYLGTTSNEFKRLVLYDFATAETIILTPPDITVRNFTIHPSGDRIYFLGIREISENDRLPPTSAQELFEVQISSQDITTLSDGSYFNNSFALSPDGSVLAIDRVPKEGTEPQKIWTRTQDDTQWTPLWKEKFGIGEVFLSPGGKYLVGPDTEVTGHVLLPSEENDGNNQFLGNFARSFGFSPNGQKILFRQNQDGDVFSRQTHFIVFDSSGQTTPILEDSGRVTQPIFSKDAQSLYFLMKPKDPSSPEGEVLATTFQIFRYDFEPPKNTTITTDTTFSIASFDLSSDERMILMERVAVTDPLEIFDPDIRIFEDLFNDNFTSDEIWIQNLETNEAEQLAIEGRSPQWMP